MKHKQLWAPWRLSYVAGDKKSPQPDRPLDLLPGADPDCFLCQCAADLQDRQRLVVCRSEQVLTVLNRYPYNNGHLLIAPRRHLARLDELDCDEQLEMTRTITRMVEALEKVINAEGFNIGLNLGGVAGAGLPGHLHWHVVPRWTGDTNFMPTTAAVKVIPQSLEALWELLSRELAT